jgi:hypothetical protein
VDKSPEVPLSLQHLPGPRICTQKQNSANSWAMPEGRDESGRQLDGFIMPFSDGGLGAAEKAVLIIYGCRFLSTHSQTFFALGQQPGQWGTGRRHGDTKQGSPYQLPQVSEVHHLWLQKSRRCSSRDQETGPKHKLWWGLWTEKTTH